MSRSARIDGATEASRYDVIVIGARLDGLAAAAWLARAGRRVLVVEKGSRPGGCAVTEELVPGHRADAVLDDPGWIPPEVLRELELARHGLELIEPDPLVVAPAPEGPPLVLHRSPRRTAESLRGCSARDASRWEGFCAAMARHAEALAALYAEPAPSLDALRLGELVRLGRRFRGFSRRELLELVRVLPMSIAELLDDTFESDRLKGALGAGATTGIMQGPHSGATAFLFLHRHAGGGPGEVRMRQRVRGGMGRLAEALAAAVTAGGGAIRYDSPVSRILIADDRARGVVLADGREVRAASVLSSEDPRHTLLDLVGARQLDPEVVQAAQAIRHRGVTARVHLAVGELPRFGGLDGVAPGGAVCIAPSLTYVERAYDRVKYGEPSDEPVLEVVIPGVADDTRRAATGHLVSVTVQYAPFRPRAGAWDAARREALGRTVVRTLAAYAPNLAASLESVCVLSPEDLQERYGLPEGSLDHGEMALDQMFFMRPLPGWARHRAPVAGLYLCGPGTHPGGRIVGGSARLAARAILRERSA